MRHSLITRTRGAMCLALTLLVVGCGDSGTSSYSGPTALPDAVRDVARNGNPAVAWNTLPGAWRTQADDLVHDFAKAVPGPLYDSALRTLGKLVNVLKTKRQFVLGSTMVKAGMAELSSAQRAQVDKAYDVVVAFGQAIATSDLRTTDTLGTATVAGLLAQIGPPGHTMMLTMMKFASEAPGREGEAARDTLAVVESLRNLTARVVSQDGANAVIAITLPGLPADGIQGWNPDFSEVPMTDVNGSWVVEGMGSGWTRAMAEGKAGIAEMASQFAADNPNAAQAQMMVQMGLGMFETALDGMAKATTQAEFDQSIAGLMGLMGGLGS